MRANDPTALYRLVQKERFFFPFTINQDGEIHVTTPLDREQKNMVNRNAYFATAYFTPFYLFYKTKCCILILTCMCVCVLVHIGGHSRRCTGC